MATATLEERYATNLHGVLSCFDRIVITGTLPGACYADGMTSFLYAHDIRIFDYPRFAEPLRERIRERAQVRRNSNDSIGSDRDNLYSDLSWKRYCVAPCLVG